MPKISIETIALFIFGPIFWGIAFLGPLMAALMISAGISAPFGMKEIYFTVLLGGLWGTYAKMKGAWL